MKIKEMEIKVNNVSEGKYKFVVARLVSGELWYYGRFETQGEAEKCAKEFENGVVLKDVTAKEPAPEVKCSRCGKTLTEFDIFMNYCPICMKALEKENGE